MNADESPCHDRVAALRCPRCERQFPPSLLIDSRGCPDCSGSSPANLRPAYPDTVLRKDLHGSAAVASMWRYASRLPCPDSVAVSLGEGLTPMLHARRIGAMIGVNDLLIKDEGRNPTWSYKDRFTSVAVSVARAQGASVVATASSGNAGASLAAYAAGAGLKCVVATFAGSAGPMLSQIRKYGATVLPMAAKADRWTLLEEGASRHGWFVTSPYRAPVVGSHPFGIEGYKTIAYEIIEQCGGSAPDWCVLPVCYGDGLAGIWAGFEELLAARVIDRAPRMIAAEVHGSLLDALERKLDHPAEQKMKFDTMAISIGAPRSTFQALNALRRSGGCAVQATNEGLIEMQEKLARHEGLFAELAAVTPLLAIEKLRRDGAIMPSQRVVALATASGLKDLDRSVSEDQSGPAFENPEDAWSWLGRSSVSVLG